jgi:uncharacterized protein YdeI (YjbR/CyaY-like superfamily)
MNMVSDSQQIYFKDRKEWRKWLEENYDKEKEIWLIYFKKHTKKTRIPYDDAVEEALCFGWIDSIVKRIDNEKYMQKFTPRKSKSLWSEANKKRVKMMIDQGRMTEAGLNKIREARKSGSWTESTPIFDSRQVPEELKQAFSRNKKAYEFYRNLTPTYKKQYNWWIISATRKETRQKRVLKAIELLEENRKLEMQ